jgi:hypothetical protein
MHGPFEAAAWIFTAERTVAIGPWMGDREAAIVPTRR